jgi:hypothetical protein
MSIYSPEFRPTYLYIKQHSITGKLYFGKTFGTYKGFTEKYQGSGTHWTRHIKKHGKEHVITLWYCLFLDKESINDFALSFCEMQNIGWSKPFNPDWLNEIPETGVDTPTPKGFTTVTDKRIRKVVCVSVETFKSNRDIYSGIASGKITAIDTNTGKSLSVSTEEFNSDRDRYSGIAIDKINVIDTVSGLTSQISSSLFYSDQTRYKHVNKGMTSVIDTTTNKIVYITNAEFVQNKHKYKGLMTNTVTALDIIDKKFVRVPSEYYYSNKHRYVNPASKIARDFKLTGNC